MIWSDFGGYLYFYYYHTNKQMQRGIDEAIENSLDRVSEKKAAARAVEMLALYREIKEDLPDLEDA